MKQTALVLGLLAAFAAGIASGQEGKRKRKAADVDPELAARLAQVRREIKQIDFEDAIARVPGIVAREREYEALVAQALDAATRSTGDVTAMLQRARTLKQAALDELNLILDLHRGKHAGLKEEEVWERLRAARFDGVRYREEWLVNILDELEDSVGINIEVDARVYKFDTVSFDFERTTARAMLQMMGDSLLFTWRIRGDTLYVYKERHEDLFGGDWIIRKKAAWKARRDAIDAAAKEAERRALEGTK